MKALELQLEIAGATWRDVTYRRLYVKTEGDEKVPNWADEPLPAYDMGGARPPSTMIGVTRLGHADFLIECDLMAVVPAGASASTSGGQA